MNYADDRPGPAFAVPGEVVALVSGGLQIYALTRAGDVIAIPQGRPSPLTEGHDAVEVAHAGRGQPPRISEGDRYAEVARVIEVARNKGWHPTQKGPPLRFRFEAGEFKPDEEA